MTRRKEVGEREEREKSERERERGRMVAVKRGAAASSVALKEHLDGVSAKKKTKLDEMSSEEKTMEDKKVPASGMTVRTVVRESHFTEIQKVVFHKQESSNLFATVGANQATIYDGRHFGEYCGLVVHYKHEEEEEAVCLTTCAFTDATKHTVHPRGDVELVVGDARGTISVISVAETAVTCELREDGPDGHSKGITRLETCTSLPGFLLSLAQDGKAKLWSIYEERCLATFQVGSAAQSLAWCPSGEWFLVGTKTGALEKWFVDDDLMQAMRQPLTTTTERRKRRKIEKASGKTFEKLSPRGVSHSAPVDDAKFIEGGDSNAATTVVTKSTDGRIFVWSASEGKRLRSWKVPCTGPCTSDIDVSGDGKYLVVGNSAGIVYVYDVEAEGESWLARLEPYKLRKRVRSCAISNDHQDIISTLGEGFLFRYRHFTPKKKKKEEEEEGEGGEGEEGEKEKEEKEKEENVTKKE